ncbi:MAG: succinyl-diaminopimelate desuccinylase [Actinomycetota bacterium]|nr:succinyl-diaminopimelate desuccinylase [Actinomycetota bacterium]
MSLSGEQSAGLVDRDRLVDRLQRLVRTPSENPPGEEKAAADLVHSMCDELGLKVTEYEAQTDRPSVVARWSGGTGPTLTYCSHIDVVPVGDPALWAADPFSGDIKDGHMHGRGSADAKGPVAAALEAVAVLKAAGFEPQGTLELALVADEETMGFQGAGYLVDEKILQPDVAIVGEPTSLRLVRAQRGANWFRISTRGVAGHGSAPERGVSAIKHMSEIVLRLEETLPDVKHELLGGPSINVGTIKGGEKTNIIPAGCVIEVDRRSIPQESQADVRASIDAALDLARKKFPDLDATVELEFEATPFEIPENASLVREMCGAIAEATGNDAEIMGFRGASDARFLRDTGADVVVCGPGDIAVAHTAHESIDLDELERCASIYALAFARLLSST